MGERSIEGAVDDSLGEISGTPATLRQIGTIAARICDMPAGACVNECLRKAMGEGACQGEDDALNLARPILDAAEELAASSVA